VVGILLFETCGNVVDIALCALYRNAGFKSPDDVISVQAPVLYDPLREFERRIDLAAFWIVKMLRQYSDDRDYLPVCRNRSVEDVLIAAETPLPETVTNDGDIIFARLILFRRKIAAHDGLHSERVEIIRGYRKSLNAFGDVAAAEIDVPPVIK